MLRQVVERGVAEEIQLSIEGVRERKAPAQLERSLVYRVEYSCVVYALDEVGQAVFDASS